ncbi:MAG: hypothetical protein WCP21_14645 [Armatimonadota bacterium]
MNAKIIDIVNAGSFWLLTVNAGDRIVEQVVEGRFMASIIEAEGLQTPSDLVGRDIELAEDGLSIGLPDHEEDLT